MPDQAYACTRCAHRARGQLIGDPTDERIIAIADATPAARDIAQGQSRHGTSSSSGKPGSRLPFDTANTQKLNRVEYVLIEKWVKPIARERGYAGVIYDAAKRGNDPIVIAATWLAGQVEWIRHRKNAADFLAAIDECTRVVRGIARGPGEQKFLGPCGAEVTWDADGNEMPRDPCPGDVFAHAGAQDGACRACGARWSTAKREAWLDGEVREHAFEARDIAEAHRLNVKTIRTWANRGALRTYWRTSADLVVEWTDPPLDDALKGEERAAREAAIADELAARGPRLHYVGDVLDLAAADAARRATEQAKRARRAAVKAEDERLSA
jgi:hypothetical protein